MCVKQEVIGFSGESQVLEKKVAMTEIEFSKNLYEELGSINKYTISNFDRAFIEKINNPIGFLKYNFQNYPSKFTSGLLLTFPSLWAQLTIEDWKSVLSSIEHREMKFIETAPLKELNLDNSYGCLIFVSKYLNVDPVKFAIKALKFSKIKKDRCLKMIKAYPFKFVEPKQDLKEDLKDFYSISYHDLRIA